MGSIFVAICFTFGLFVYNRTVAKDQQIASASLAVRIFIFLFTLIAFLGSLLIPAGILFFFLWGTGYIFPYALYSPNLLSYVHLSVVTSFAMILYELIGEPVVKLGIKKLGIPYASIVFAEILTETTLLLLFASLWVNDITLSTSGALFASGCRVGAMYLPDYFLSRR